MCSIFSIKPFYICFFHFDFGILYILGTIRLHSTYVFKTKTNEKTTTSPFRDVVPVLCYKGPGDNFRHDRLCHG